MRAIGRIFGFASHLWPYYIGISLGSVVLALLSQAQPILTKMAIDRLPGVVGGQTEMMPVLVVVAALFASDVGATLVSNYAGYHGDVMSAKLRSFLSTRYYDHLLTLSQRYYSTELTGTIISRLNRSISGISTFVNMFANNFLQLILTTVFTLIVVAQYSPVVAVLFASLYPIFLWLTSRTSKKWQSYQSEINTALDTSSGRFAEVVGQIRVTKSYVAEKLESRHFAHGMNKTVKVTQPQSTLWHTQDVYRRLVLNLIFGVVYIYIFYEAVNGRLTVGETVLLLQYGVLIRLPIFSMSWLVDNTQRAIADSKDFFAAMAEKPEVLDRPNAKAIRVAQGAIRFEDVSFGYESDRVVLDSIKFEVSPGSKVALVGESGEGKTTISNLLLRFYDPTQGSISIDDQDISTVTQSSLRKSIAVVFQEATLFSGTVKENIAYGNPSASMKAIRAAAKAANALGFVESLSDGFDTLVGERGIKLSGGQKQRIAIARAILKNAPILVLDEATSSLDSKSEAEVQSALTTLMKSRTTIIIAHRLSTIADVDKIITLKNGRVDEIGSPAQLALTDGIYAQLLSLQSKSDAATKKKLKQYELSS